MSWLDRFVEGTRISLTSLERHLGREASEFKHPLRINTGKAESQWLGACLLKLSAEGGSWQAVPWRMLRNTYMHYGFLKCLQLRKELRLPRIPEDEPVVIYVSGGGTPIDELLNGVRHMIDCDLVEIITWGEEHYLAPSNKLLNCAPKAFDMMSATS